MFDRDSWLIATGDVIAGAIERRDTGHAIFHGCYDWHSAVHGHWALLRIARVTGEPRFADLVDQRLTSAGLAAELALLRSEPAFELPYGRAWLLRLAIEHAEVTGADHRLRVIADQAASSLVAHYAARPPSPASREYANASWALVQLAAYADQIADRLLAATVKAHVDRDFLEPDDVPLFEADHRNTDFFSPRGNWLYLLAHTQRPAVLDRMLVGLDDEILRAVDPIQPAAHHYGVNWSRAWLLHRLALLYPTEPLYRRAFDAHVEVGLRDHRRGLGDYAYDHWVPQFAVYALTEDAA